MSRNRSPQEETHTQAPRIQHSLYAYIWSFADSIGRPGGLSGVIQYLNEFISYVAPLLRSDVSKIS